MEAVWWLGGDPWWEDVSIIFTRIKLENCILLEKLYNYVLKLYSVVFLYVVCVD